MPATVLMFDSYFLLSDLFHSNFSVTASRNTQRRAVPAHNTDSWPIRSYSPPPAPPIFCDAVLFRCFPRRFVTDVSSFLVSTVHLFCEIWCFHCVECQNWPALWNTTPRSLVGGGGVLLLTVGIFHRPAASGILYDSSSRNATFFEKSQCFILFLCKLKLMGFWSDKTVVYLVHRKL